MSILRKLRGLLGVGVTWGALWGTIGAVAGFIMGRMDPFLWVLGNPVIEWGLGIGAYGVISGIGFGTLLSLREGRRTLEDLSLMRVALWGVLGSAAVPLLFGALGFFGSVSVVDVLQAIALCAGLGGVFAPGSVAIARHAELAAGRERALLE